MWPALTIAMLLAIAAPRATQAQGADDLAALNQRVSELYNAGKYSEAITLAEKSLEITRRQKGEYHLDTAARAGWLGGLYKEQGRYVEAEPLYKRELEIRERVLGKEQKWLHNFGRCGRWNFCLTTGTLVPANQERQ
ncbi:MAG: tetratricopeptide repeat protein [Rhodomicrobium sp.]